MGKPYSFKFLDNGLHRELIGLLRKIKLDYSIDQDGLIHYSPDDDVVVHNDLICSIRQKVFPCWQVQTCPSDWVDRYRNYMTSHDIPFREELSNGEIWFLLPRKYRPHAWKLAEPVSKKRSKPRSVSEVA